MYSIVAFDNAVENQYLYVDKIIMPKTFLDISQDYLNLFNFIDKCYGLKFIDVNNFNQLYYSDEQGILFNKDKIKLIICPRGKKGEIEMPNFIKTKEEECDNCGRVPTEIKDAICRSCNNKTVLIEDENLFLLMSTLQPKSEDYIKQSMKNWRSSCTT